MTSRRKTASASKRATPARAARARVQTASQKPAKSSATSATTRKVAASKPSRKTKGPATARQTAEVIESAVTEAAAVASVAPGPECTIAHAEALHAQLAALLSQPAAVSLDLSAVKRIDTAGLQVLAAFVRHRRLAGLELQCSGASEPFLGTAKLLGLQSLFASPVPA